MTYNETIIKAHVMDALLKTLESSVYDTDDDQLNSYITGATIAAKNILDELKDLDWFNKNTGE